MNNIYQDKSNLATNALHVVLQNWMLPKKYERVRLLEQRIPSIRQDILKSKLNSLCRRRKSNVFPSRPAREGSEGGDIAENENIESISELDRKLLEEAGYIDEDELDMLEHELSSIEIVPLLLAEHPDAIAEAVSDESSVLMFSMLDTLGAINYLFSNFFSPIAKMIQHQAISLLIKAQKGYYPLMEILVNRWFRNQQNSKRYANKHNLVLFQLISFQSWQKRIETIDLSLLSLTVIVLQLEEQILLCRDRDSLPGKLVAALSELGEYDSFNTSTKSLPLELCGSIVNEFRQKCVKVLTSARPRLPTEHPQAAFQMKVQPGRSSLLLSLRGKDLQIVMRNLIKRLKELNKIQGEQIFPSLNSVLTGSGFTVPSVPSSTSSCSSREMMKNAYDLDPCWRNRVAKITDALHLTLERDAVVLLVLMHHGLVYLYNSLGGEDVASFSQPNRPALEKLFRQDLPINAVPLSGDERNDLWEIKTVAKESICFGLSTALNNCRTKKDYVENKAPGAQTSSSMGKEERAAMVQNKRKFAIIMAKRNSIGNQVLTLKKLHEYVLQCKKYEQQLQTLSEDKSSSVNTSKTYTKIVENTVAGPFLAYNDKESSIYSALREGFKALFQQLAALKMQFNNWSNCHRAGGNEWSVPHLLDSHIFSLKAHQSFLFNVVNILGPTVFQLLNSHSSNTAKLGVNVNPLEIQQEREEELSLFKDMLHFLLRGLKYRQQFFNQCIDTIAECLYPSCISSVPTIPGSVANKDTECNHVVDILTDIQIVSNEAASVCLMTGYSDLFSSQNNSKQSFSSAPLQFFVLPSHVSSPLTPFLVSAGKQNLLLSWNTQVSGLMAVMQSMIVEREKVRQKQLGEETKDENNEEYGIDSGEEEESEDENPFDAIDVDADDFEDTLVKCFWNKMMNLMHEGSSKSSKNSQRKVQNQTPRESHDEIMKHYKRFKESVLNRFNKGMTTTIESWILCDNAVDCSDSNNQNKCALYRESVSIHFIMVCLLIQLAANYPDIRNPSQSVSETRELKSRLNHQESSIWSFYDRWCDCYHKAENDLTLLTTVSSSVVTSLLCLMGNLQRQIARIQLLEIAVVLWKGVLMANIDKESANPMKDNENLTKILSELWKSIELGSSTMMSLTMMRNTSSDNRNNSAEVSLLPLIQLALSRLYTVISGSDEYTEEIMNAIAEQQEEDKNVESLNVFKIDLLSVYLHWIEKGYEALLFQIQSLVYVFRNSETDPDGPMSNEVAFVWIRDEIFSLIDWNTESKDSTHLSAGDSNQFHIGKAPIGKIQGTVLNSNVKRRKVYINRPFRTRSVDVAREKLLFGPPLVELHELVSSCFSVSVTLYGTLSVAICWMMSRLHPPAVTTHIPRAHLVLSTSLLTLMNEFKMDKSNHEKLLALITSKWQERLIRATKRLREKRIIEEFGLAFAENLETEEMSGDDNTFILSEILGLN